MVHLAGALLLPPSARWLLAAGGDPAEAARSIEFYRGTDHDVSGEVREIQKTLGGEVTAPTLLSQARRLATDWSCAKPVLLLSGQFVFDAFCGGMTVTQFAPMIFRRAVPQLDPHSCTVYLAAVQLAALCGSGALVRRVGRRVVLAVAGTCGAAGYLLVAVSLLSPAVGAYSWIPLIGVLLANAAAQAGITPVSFLYLSELPSHGGPTSGRQLVRHLHQRAEPLRGAAVPGGDGGGGDARRLPGRGRPVWGAAGLRSLLLLPETKDMSLEEVQQRHFSSKRSWGGENDRKDLEAATEKPPRV